MSTLNQSEIRESAAAASQPCRSIVRRRVSKSAYMRAIETEGAYVASPEGEGWWRDQERRHPCIMAGGNRPESTDSPNGHRNRFGKASYRFIPGKGRFVWQDGKWVTLKEEGKKHGLQDRHN